MMLHEMAHSRAGDKGNTVNISVIAYDDRAYRHICRYLTPELVLRKFAPLASGPVRRFELPSIRACNFVIDGALDGGVTASLRQDIHGKGLSSLMLMIELPAFDTQG